jgi:hypothetical protein
MNAHKAREGRHAPASLACSIASGADVANFMMKRGRRAFY